MGRMSREESDRSATLHRKRIGQGGTSFLRYDDVLYCIPDDLRGVIYERIPGADEKRLWDAVHAMAYAVCQNAFEAGKKAAESHDAHKLKSLGYEEAKADMRRWLDGEDG